jgi:sn-glycerol 3-phosphate transport system ATP-binding protein
MNLLRNAPDSKAGVIIGVRPEHLDITTSGWGLKVEAVEMLGAERLIYGRWAHASADGQSNETVIVRTEESYAPPAVGATLFVTPRAGRIHHFDAGTGRRMENL